MSIWKKRCMALALLGSLTSTAQAQTQEVALIAEGGQGEQGGDRAMVYYAPTGEVLSTGLGFRLHYDSSRVELLGLREHLSESSLGIQIMPDTEDLDNNADTDQYINAAWADLVGEWPADADSYPARLYEIEYRLLKGSLNEAFRFSLTDAAVGYEFQSRIVARE